MGNICDFFSNREREKEQPRVVTPCYIQQDIQQDIQSNTKGIPVQQYPQVGVINHTLNGTPVVIYANQNPISDGFTSGLLGGLILSDLVDDCY
tara:strand:+ start:261 stop:539 length:279 start_codon:yes stop_codon:yes gene_type:complete